MAKKGGNKKKSAARNNKKKIITTPSSSNENSSPPSPTAAVDSTANSSTESLTTINASSASLSRPAEVVQQLAANDKALDTTVSTPVDVAVAGAVVTDQEDIKDSRVIDTTKIPSECSFENVVDQLEIATDIVHVQKNDASEEPPHVEVKAEPAVVTLDSAPLLNDTTEPVVEKSSLPELKPVEDVSLNVEENIKPIDEIKSVTAEIKTVESVKSATVFEETKPVEKVIETAKPVEEIEATKEAEVVEEVKSIQQPIATEVQPLAECKPVETVVPILEAALVEEVKPVQDIKSPQSTDEAEVADKEVELVQASQENNNDVVAQKTPNVVLSSALTQVYDTITIEGPSVILTEVTPTQSGVESSAVEDTHTLGSQSVLTEALSATTEQSTIEEECYQEIPKPVIVQELIKDNTKKSFLKKSRSVMGNINSSRKDPSVTKRKSQILGLFKRGNDKVNLIKNSGYQGTNKKILD